MEIVLIAPEIPGNTGSVGRVAVGTGSRLHLVGPLGFDISAAAVRRAGLDYWDDVDLVVHDGVDALLRHIGERRVWAYSTHGQLRYDEVRYLPEDFLVFGSESRGLPPALRARWAQTLCYLPVRRAIRSLNLATAVTAVVYEAHRQQGFAQIDAAGGR